MNPSDYNIAFRFSSKLKNPSEGFVFGRIDKTCDVSVGPEVKSISKRHFRIYFNEHGILMLEDMSSLAGTFVNGNLLRTRYKPEEEKGHSQTYTLASGSQIRILCARAMTESRPDQDIVFLVRIPIRQGRHAEAYKENLINYLAGPVEVDPNKTIMPGPEGPVRQGPDPTPDAFSHTSRYRLISSEPVSLPSVNCHHYLDLAA